MMRRIIVCCLVLFAGSAAAQEGVSRKEADLRRLSELLNSQALNVPALSDMVMGRPRPPEITVEKWNEIKLEMNNEMLKSMNAPGGPIYEWLAFMGKRMSESEVQEVVAFFESPVGKKYLTVSAEATSATLSPQALMAYVFSMRKTYNDVAKKHGL